MTGQETFEVFSTQLLSFVPNKRLQAQVQSAIGSNDDGALVSNTDEPYTSERIEKYAKGVHDKLQKETNNSHLWATKADGIINIGNETCGSVKGKERLEKLANSRRPKVLQMHHFPVGSKNSGMWGKREGSRGWISSWFTSRLAEFCFTAFCFGLVAMALWTDQDILHLDAYAVSSGSSYNGGVELLDKSFAHDAFDEAITKIGASMIVCASAEVSNLVHDYLVERHVGCEIIHAVIEIHGVVLKATVACDITR
jgi:hypothetical protein